MTARKIGFAVLALSPQIHAFTRMTARTMVNATPTGPWEELVMRTAHERVRSLCTLRMLFKLSALAMKANNSIVII